MKKRNERKLNIVSDEAFNLLQLGIRVDASLRKLSVYAIEQKYSRDQYFSLVSRTTDAIFVYRQFLDELHTKLKSGLKFSVAGKDFSPHFIKGVLGFLRSNGKEFNVKTSTEIGADIFRLTASTDVIVRICVELGWNQVDQAIAIKNEIQTNIKTFKLAADDCSSEYYKVKARIEHHKRTNGKRP